MDANQTKQAAEAAQRRADELKAKADQMSESASAMYGRFAGGQPLLVGHHSYRSAVRDRDRADNATRRAIEARQEAERARAKANKARAEADLANIAAGRSRPWQRSDFQPGDIVTVRTHRTVTDVYRVKRANAKTLTLEGPGGGIDDPKRGYDRVLSRTRNGITITDPDSMSAADGPDELAAYGATAAAAVLPTTPAELAAQINAEGTPANGFPSAYAPLVARIGRLAAARMYHDACLLLEAQRAA